MNKKLIKNLYKLIVSVFLFIVLTNTEVLAYEDYLITTNAKLTDISVENHDIIDVYPFITILNDKNTLMVHPLKEGKSNFSILKNGKEKVTFSVTVETEKTTIDNKEGFNILAIDAPPSLYDFELDLPPEIK